MYEGIEDIWPDYPTKDDFFFNEEEYWKLKIISFETPLQKGGVFFWQGYW
jgi:hypothetical protein